MMKPSETDDVDEACGSSSAAYICAYRYALVCLKVRRGGKHLWHETTLCVIEHARTNTSTVRHQQGRRNPSGLTPCSRQLSDLNKNFERLSEHAVQDIANVQCIVPRGSRSIGHRRLPRLDAAHRCRARGKV